MLGWALSLAAEAAEPLVYTGDEARAVTRAAAAARLPATDLAPTSVESLRGDPPTVGAGGTLTPCGGPTVTREQLLLAVQGAEGALNYGETDRARTELDRVADADRCAAWDADLLGRYFVLRGLLDPDPGPAFARARRLNPALAWNEEWPADRRPAFDAGAAGDAVVLTVPLAGAVLDGAAVTGKVQVVPGWHRVQAPGFDGALELEADGTFLVPAEVAPTAFEALDTEDGRFLPTTMLASRYGDGTRVFVATDRGVWAATAGRVDWLALERQRRHPLVGAGLVTAGVGAVGSALLAGLAASAYGAAGAAADAVETTGFAQLGAAKDTYDAKAATYRTLRTAVVAPIGVTVAGLGLFGVGVALGPQTVGGQ